MSGEGFISRWSRRKLEAKEPARTEVPAAAPPQSSEAQALPPEAPVPAPLPDVESLTPESDFTPFMQPEVDAGTRRAAVKRLFQDPRYNVMDGLDVYIDDYSKPDPLPEGWLEKLTQMSRLGEYKAPEAEADPVPSTDGQPAKTAAATPPDASVVPESPIEPPITPPDTPDGGLESDPLRK